MMELGGTSALFYILAPNVSAMEECITASEASPMHYDIAPNGT